MIAGRQAARAASKRVVRYVWTRPFVVECERILNKHFFPRASRVVRALVASKRHASRREGRARQPPPVKSLDRQMDGVRTGGRGAAERDALLVGLPSHRAQYGIGTIVVYKAQQLGRKGARHEGAIASRPSPPDTILRSLDIFYSRALLKVAASREVRSMPAAAAPPFASAAIAVLCAALALVALVALAHVRRAPRARERFEIAEDARTVLVGISGRPCAGKSTVARHVRALLKKRGFRATVVKQDNFRSCAQADYYDFYQYKGLLGEVTRGDARLDTLLQTRGVLCARFFKEVRSTYSAGKYDFVIVEGSKCFSDSSLADYMVKIWLHYPPYPQCAHDKRRAPFVKPLANWQTRADHLFPRIQQRHPDLHEFDSQRHSASWLAQRVLHLALAARAANHGGAAA